MTEATAHVDEKGCFGLQTVAKTFRHRVKAFVTPAALSLTVAAHVVVELFCVFRALREPDEERILRLVCELERPVSDVPRVSIAGFLQVGGDGVE